MATSNPSDGRRVVVDLVAIAAVAVLLVGIHLLVPPGVRSGLALTYPNPNPVDALTAAYVHANGAHLTGNLAGYLVGASVAYGLARAAGERRWFWLSWGTCLTALPIVVGLLAAALVARPIAGRGFSGVVAGLAGVVLVGAGVVAHRTFGTARRSMWEVIAMLAVVVAAEILWLATDAGQRLIGGVLVVGLGLPLASLARRAAAAGRPGGREGWVRVAGAALVVGLVLGIVTWLVVGLFPSRLVHEGGITNVLGHYLGLVGGGIVAAWGYRYWSVDGPNRGS